MKKKTAALCLSYAFLMCGCTGGKAPAVQEAGFDEILTFTGITVEETTQALTDDTEKKVTETTTASAASVTETEETTLTEKAPADDTVSASQSVTGSESAESTESPASVTDDTGTEEPEEPAPMIIFGGREYILSEETVEADADFFFAGIVAKFTDRPEEDYSSNFAPVGTGIYYPQLGNKDIIAVSIGSSADFTLLYAADDEAEEEPAETSVPEIVFEEIESVVSVLGTEAAETAQTAAETDGDISVSDSAANDAIE